MSDDQPRMGENAALELPPVKPTSEAIRVALRLRFPADQHALLFEVADSTGAAQRRYLDAVAVGLWPSHGHKVEGIEIKVSRGDFLREMKDASKSQAVFKYCHRFWLAAPKDMVQPAELPPSWGLLELLADGTLRVKKKASELEPLPMPPGFIAALLRRHAGVDEDMARAHLRREEQVIAARIRTEVEGRLRTEHNRHVEQAKVANEAWQKVKDETGIDFRTLYDAGDLVRAVKVYQALGGRWHSPLQQLGDGARALLKTLDEHGLGKEDGR